MDNVERGRTVIVNGVGGQHPREISQAEICEIIAPRIEEIFEMVKDKIIEKTTLTSISGNIILTGGGAKMDGIVECVQDSFDTDNVRIGYPEKMGGIEEDYAGPDWSTVIGLVRACKDTVVRQPKKAKKLSKNVRTGEHSENKILKMLKSLF